MTKTIELGKPKLTPKPSFNSRTLEALNKIVKEDWKREMVHNVLLELPQSKGKNSVIITICHNNIIVIFYKTLIGTNGRKREKSTGSEDKTQRKADLTRRAT